MEEKRIKEEVERRFEQLVAKHDKEDLLKRKEEIEAEVQRRVEEIKRVMDRQLLEEMEKQRLEAQRKNKNDDVDMLLRADYGDTKHSSEDDRSPPAYTSPASPTPYTSDYHQEETDKALSSAEILIFSDVEDSSNSEPGHSDPRHKHEKNRKCLDLKRQLKARYDQVLGLQRLLEESSTIQTEQQQENDALYNHIGEVTNKLRLMSDLENRIASLKMSFLQHNTTLQELAYSKLENNRITSELEIIQKEYEKCRSMLDEKQKQFRDIEHLSKRSTIQTKDQNIPLEDSTSAAATETCLSAVSALAKTSLSAASTSAELMDSLRTLRKVDYQRQKLFEKQSSTVVEAGERELMGDERLNEINKKIDATRQAVMEIRQRQEKLVQALEEQRDILRQLQANPSSEEKTTLLKKLLDAIEMEADMKNEIEISSLYTVPDRHEAFCLLKLFDEYQGDMTQIQQCLADNFKIYPKRDDLELLHILKQLLLPEGRLRHLFPKHMPQKETLRKQLLELILNPSSST